MVNENVLIVEDIISTGSTVKKVINAVRETGGRVVGVSVIVNESLETINTTIDGITFSSLSTLHTPLYEESLCPLCRQRIPINTTLGEGGQFLDKRFKLYEVAK